MIDYFSLKKKIYLNSLNSISGKIDGITNLYFSSISEFGVDKKNNLCFYEDDNINLNNYRKSFKSIIIIKKEFSKKFKKKFPASNLLITKNPRLVFVKIINECLNLNVVENSIYFPKITKISKKALIQKNVLIEKNVQIDSNVFIGSGSIIKSGVWIKKNSVILENSVLGSYGINNPIIENGKNYFFPHLGCVILEENTRIGSHCAIVRGIMKNTCIGKNSIIGNFCNIGHSVNIEKNAWIASNASIGGFTHIGKKSNIGLGAVIKNNLIIGEKVNVGMGSIVTKSLKNNTCVFGNPAKKIYFLKSGPN